MRKKSSNKCVYLHINPIKQEVFYVGIGLKQRPYSFYDRTKWWKNIVNKYGYDIVVIHENLTLKEACKLERKYIKQIGRRMYGKGPLVNIKRGGRDKFNEKRKLGVSEEEVRVYKMNETKKKNGTWRIPRTEEQKRSTSISLMGHSVSKETIEKSKAKWDLREKKTCDGCQKEMYSPNLARHKCTTERNNEIRKLLETKTNKEVGELFNLNADYIRMIKKNNL